ncbi:hypothetical protein DFQ01_10230 [Paenibacillus cellulosilyticus]|uniref:Uncharacterized protein n=1 Tax=Paenibacillus cellulosilyticus TaxID=375489 RepID=A0A2V2YY02_9BACL|nr:hypothetical protein DFQ01_10230 [Paenibacillus cellulosilyticus]
MGLPSPGPRKDRRGMDRSVNVLLCAWTRVTLWVKLTLVRGAWRVRDRDRNETSVAAQRLFLFRLLINNAAVVRRIR